MRFASDDVRAGGVACCGQPGSDIDIGIRGKGMSGFEEMICWLLGGSGLSAEGRQHPTAATRTWFRVKPNALFSPSQPSEAHNEFVARCRAQIGQRQPDIEGLRRALKPSMQVSKR